MYNEKVISIFQHPKNIGEIRSASGIGKVGDVEVGEVVKVYLKVEDNIIIQAKAKAFGGVATIVCADIAMGLIKNKSIEQALEITNQDIINQVGELPTTKQNCAILVQDAIADAVKDNRKRQLRASLKQSI